MKNLKIIFLIMFLFLFWNCSSEEVKKTAADPLAAFNSTLEPTKIDGYGKGLTTPSASSQSNWEKTLFPVIKGVHDNLPAGIKLQVVGHTCSRGNEQVNKVVGDKRAQVVHDLLVKKGFQKDKLTQTSVGSSQTLSGLDPQDEKNRRVSFKVVKE
jgi:flagellar motor protein MotB